MMEITAPESVPEISEDEKQKAQAEKDLARAVHNARQPYITAEEYATLRSLRVVKDFFARIDYAQYFPQRGLVPWETIGLALRFFMGDIRCANKAIASRARFERRRLGLSSLCVTSESALTSDMCMKLAQWISCVSTIRAVREGEKCPVYVIAGFSIESNTRSLSCLRSVQLLHCLAEILQERENAIADNASAHP
jgi:hypothetical protein